MHSKEKARHLLLIGLFTAPFIQGLYFYFEICLMTLLIVGLLIYVMSDIKEFIYDKTRILFYGGFLLFGMTSLFFAVDIGMAILGVMKTMAYFLGYLLIQQLMTKTFKHQLIQVLIYSGLFMAVLSLIFLVFKVLSSFVVQNGRLGGFFQYANTFGLFMLVCILLLFIEPFPVYFKIIGGSVLIIAMIMTFSRGVLYIGLLWVTILFAIELVQGKWHFSLKNIKDYRHFNRKLIKKLTTIKGFSIKTMTVTGLLSTVLVTLLIPLTGQRGTAERIGESLSSSEFLSRLIYYKDGLSMIRLFPFGSGHMGYRYIQEAYQSGADYFVKFIHNSLLQMTLDYGILAGILLLMFMVCMLLDNRLSIENRLVVGIVFVHSMVDFDFQFGIIWFVIIILTTVSLEKELNLYPKKSLHKGIASVTGLLYLFAFFVTFMHYTNRYEVVLAVYPWHTEAKIDQFRTIEDMDEKYNFALILAEDQPYFTESFAYIRDYAYNSKDYGLAYEYALICMEKNPIKISHIERYSQILLSCANEASKNNRQEEVRFYVEKIYEIPDYLEALELKYGTQLKVKHKVDFEMTKSLVDDYLQADALY